MVSGVSLLSPHARIALPTPTGGASLLDAVLRARRSVRTFSAEPLTLAAASHLLWAAQGVVTQDGRRTTPSAGALYPLELYLVAAEVRDLPAGVYRYLPNEHELTLVDSGDRRRELARAAYDQDCVLAPPALLAATALYGRTAVKYGARAELYVPLEAGAAAQNVALAAVGLGLGSVVVGAFDDEAVRKALGAGTRERPLWLVPVGRPE